MFKGLPGTLGSGIAEILIETCMREHYCDVKTRVGLFAAERELTAPQLTIPLFPVSFLQCVERVGVKSTPELGWHTAAELLTFQFPRGQRGDRQHPQHHRHHHPRQEIILTHPGTCLFVRIQCRNRCKSNGASESRIRKRRGTKYTLEGMGNLAV